MALVLKDRVKESSTSSGTGSITLGGAFVGFQTFNSAVASGSTVYYTIHNTTAGNDQEWEVGVGTFTAPSTLSRDTVFSSSAGGSKVSFSGSSVLEVFITQPAEQAVYINDATGKVEIFGNGTNTVTFTNINTTNLTANTVTLTAGTITTNATNATDITNKTYVDNLFSTGITYHAPVLVETPSALTATYNQPGGAGNGVGATLTNSGANVALVIDGVSVSNTARVLVYQQSNAVQNGVYTVTNPGAPDSPGPGAAWVLTRATDADTYGVGDPNKLGQGDAFFVTSGNTGAGETYILNTVGAITFGTTNLTFAQISSAQIYNAGTGLNLANLTFSIANTAVTAATYGNDGNVAQITVNAQGQLTNAANVAINASSITVGTLAVARGGTGTGTAGITALNNILGSSLAGTTGTNTANLVFSTSPTITSPAISTSITTGSSTFTLINATATTVNCFGSTTTLNQGASTANVTHNYSTGATLSGNTKTINLGTAGVSGSTTNVNIGSANGTTVTVNGTTNLSNVNVSGNVSVGGSISGNGAAISAINASNISSGTITNARTTAASANGASTIVQRDSGGNFSANTITANISGDISGGTNINASNITSGTIANARTTASSSNGASTIVLRDAGGAFAAGAITGTSFSGNGAAITAINASAITTGTLDNARTSASSANGASTIVARDANGSFAGNTVTATTGSFTSVSGNGVALTAINASNITSGTLDNARTTAASANGASTIVARDTNGSFTANVGTFTTISGAGGGLSGINASNISTGTIANARTTASDANGASTIVSRDANGAFSAGIITADGSGLSAINASNISSGTIANARTTAASANGASTIVLRGTSGEFSAGAITSTSISGNGVALTAINASNVTSGTLDNARTSAASANGASTIVARDTNGSFAGNVVTATTGSFTSVSGNGVALTAINASNISSGTIANARTTASDANGASTIVSRDANGSFTANVVTATTFSGGGGSISAINASNISSGTIANARTTAASANGASTIVARGASGEFSAGAITGASFTGDGSALSAINASNVSSGTLSAGRGGTGQTSLTAENVILGNAANAVKFVAPGTNGNVLTSNGTTWVSQAAGGGFAAGTVMLFAQTAAPTGWTKNTTTGDNSALRVTTGTASTGGSVAFTTAFASQTPAGTIANTTAGGTVSISAISGSAGATTLSTPQIPSHSHTYQKPISGYSGSDGTGGGGAPTLDTGATGGGGSHTHPFSFSSGTASFTGTAHNHTFTGNAINLAVQYIDVIRATKD